MHVSRMQIDRRTPLRWRWDNYSNSYYEQLIYLSLLAVTLTDLYPTAMVSPGCIIPSGTEMQNSAPSSFSLYVYDSSVNETSTWKVSNLMSVLALFACLHNRLDASAPSVGRQCLHGLWHAQIKAHIFYIPVSFCSRFSYSVVRWYQSVILKSCKWILKEGFVCTMCLAALIAPLSIPCG